MRIPFLDWLRIFAFVSVFIGHKFGTEITALAQDPNAHATLRLIAATSTPLWDGGGAGVVVFFLVSGYIISHVLQQENVAEFAIKRVFRIYPLYIFAVLLHHFGRWIIQGHGVSFPTLLGEMSLFGDFLHVSPSLGGVEWTLRIEILFYIFMAACKALGLLNGQWQRFFPPVLAACGFCLLNMTAFPTFYPPTRGYVTLYAPMLLIGALFHLRDRGQISSLLLFGASTALFLDHLVVLPRINDPFMNSHFTLAGLLIFTALWLVRSRLSLPGWALWLSNLTYSVYLFHDWLFNFFLSASKALPIGGLGANVLAVGLLIASCVVASRVVERPAIRYGRRVAANITGKD